MFCSSCGTRMQIKYKFCPSCGNAKGHDKGEENNNAPSSESQTSSRPTTSFKSFMSKKQEERASHFRPSKKPRFTAKQEVTINIGVMELNEKNESVPLRGKSLPLKIGKE